MDLEQFKALLIDVKERGSADETTNQQELLDYIQSQLKQGYTGSTSNYD